MNACDWAGCTRLGHHHDAGFWHCERHYEEHLEEFPKAEPRGLRHGTEAAYRWHQQQGAQPCMECRVGQSQRNAKQYAARVARGGQPKPKPVIECGTQAGYRRHLREQSIRCRPCLDAHNEYLHGRRAA